ISELEDELDRFAAALHGRQKEIGLSYQQIKAREGRIYTDWPTVRLLPQLQNVLASLSAQTVDALSQKLENIGRLFRQADAVINPWKDRQPALQESVSLRSDVMQALDRLLALDEQHAEHARSVGLGIPLPSDRGSFVSLGPEVIQRF